MPGQWSSQFLRQPRPHVCMFSKSPILNSSCRLSPGLKEQSLWQKKKKREIVFPGLWFRLNSDGLPGKESWGPQKVVGSWRRGKSVPWGRSPTCPPAHRPWLTAEQEKPARHTGTLHLLRDPKCIKMGTLTPATRSGSGMNWGLLRSPTWASSHRKNIYSTELCFLESCACNNLHRSSRVLATAGFCLLSCLRRRGLCVCVCVRVSMIMKQSAIWHSQDTLLYFNQKNKGHKLNAWHGTDTRPGSLSYKDACLQRQWLLPFPFYWIHSCPP